MRKQLKKLVSALVIGAVAISLPITTDAKRIQDKKTTTKTEVRQYSKKDKTKKVERGNEAAFYQEGGEMFTPNAEIAQGMYAADYFQTEAENFVPQTVSVYDTSISGTPLATQEQCVRYLLEHNPYPNLAVTAEEIVAYYYEEGAREGIRPDVAFAQALKETGFFRYGGDVVPEQNNYCGLGTTGGGVKGEFFATPQMGVRAHIQHLLAYSSTRRPLTPIIDPRYDVVRNAYGDRILSNWQDLNGRWAVPGRYYGQEILSMFKAILMQ